MEFNTPVCEFSKQQATKVCINPTCDQIPFLCSGECVSHACTKLHKHSGQFRLLDYPALKEFVTKLQDPNRLQQQFVESVTESITQLIESLKLMVKRFRTTMMSRDMTFRTSAVVLSTLQKIQHNQFSKLTGKQLSKLVDGTACENQFQIQTKIKSQNSKITNIIQSVQELVNYYHGAYDFRQRSEKFLNQAVRTSSIQPRQSLTSYSKAIQFNPNNTIAIIGRAEVLTKLQNFDEALKDYNRVLNLDPNNHQVHNAKGVLLHDHFSQHKESIKQFTKAIEINPLQISYYNNRCNAYIDINDYKSALKDINQVIQQKGNESWFYIKRAQIKRKLGMDKQALDDQKKAQELKKNTEK